MKTKECGLAGFGSSMNAQTYIIDSDELLGKPPSLNAPII